MGLYVYSPGTLFEAIVNHRKINSLPIQAPASLLRRRDVIEFHTDFDDTMDSEMQAFLGNFSMKYR